MESINAPKTCDKKRPSNFIERSPSTMLVGSAPTRQMSIKRWASRVGLNAPTTPVPAEKSLLYVYSVQPTSKYRLWADGHEIATEPIPTGGVNIADMESCPTVWPQAAFDCVQFHVPRVTLDHFAEETQSSSVGSYDCSKVVYDPVLGQLTELILPSLTSEGGLPELFMDYFVLLFCAHVMESQSGGGRPTMGLRGLSTVQKKRATELLANHLDGGVTLRRVATECGLSVSQFARSFKTSFGVPVHRWVVAKRIEKAKSLLVEGDCSLIDVAFCAGYSDQAAFTRGFTKAVGVSPGRWRRAKTAYPKSLIAAHNYSLPLMVS